MLSDCGIMNFDSGSLDIGIMYKFTDLSDDVRGENINRCIEEHGYVRLGKSDCTKNGKDLGVCN